MKKELTPEEMGRNLEEFYYSEERKERVAKVTDQEVDELARAIGVDLEQARALIVARIGREVAEGREEFERQCLAAAKAKRAKVEG